MLPVAAEEDRKWRHVVNGVGSSPSSHVTSGMEGTALWTPVGSPATPISSPRPGPSSDAPLNLTVSRTTRRLSSPPCMSPDDRPTAGGVPRRQAENSPVGSPPPAHNPYVAAKSDGQAARKSNNEVESSDHTVFLTIFSWISQAVLILFLPDLFLSDLHTST